MKAIRLAIGILGALMLPIDAFGQEPADLAWNRGELAVAEPLYAARLAADSADQRALHRMALLRAWDDELETSLALLDRLLELAPGNVEAARDRARVLGWMGEFDAARAAYEAVLRTAPNDTEAQVGLGRVLLWSGEERRAEAMFAEVLAANPRDPDALEGYAMTASWTGRLVEGESRWRSALDVEPDRVAFLLGLAQTLRWQGREAAALEPVRVARALEPENPAVVEEAEILGAALASFAHPRVTYESDSDGNRITGISIGTTWRPAPRIGIDLEVYRQDTEDTSARADAAGGFEAAAEGFWVGVTGVTAPGWHLSSAIGVDDGELGAETQFRASVRTPARHPVGGSVAVARRALNATTRSMQRGVTVEEVAVTGHVTPSPGWWIEAGASVADFEGRATNRRVAGHAYAQRSLGSDWTLAVLSRALAFDLDVNEGYFDPSSYSVSEFEIGWSREIGKWQVGWSVAPGLQYLGDSEDWSATANGFARAEYRFHPGRVIALNAAMATAGVNSLTTGEADYRYYSIGVSTRWAFSID